MEPKNNSEVQSLNVALLRKRMVLGAGIALVLMVLLLIQVNDPNPEWGRLWMIRPLIVGPMAGGVGGAFYHFMDQLSLKRNWNGILIKIFSLIVYIIGLWMGFILGLAGTLWN